MSGRHSHAVTRVARRPRAIALLAAPRRPFAVRKLLGSAAAMLVALGLAATMAIPAASASSEAAGSGQLYVPSAQSAAFSAELAVGQDFTVDHKALAGIAIRRDGSTISRSALAAGPSISGAGGWVAPIDVRIVSGWGPRAVICTAGVGCDSGFHQGDDFAAACGRPFYAVAAGTVVSVRYAGLAGDQIVISHGNGVTTAYSHMFDSGILVTVGQTVTAGQNIGLIGSSGDSTGCHMYFEYRVKGEPVNPEPAMAAHGVTLG